jgi:hypothetical protein
MLYNNLLYGWNLLYFLFFLFLLHAYFEISLFSFYWKLVMVCFFFNTHGLSFQFYPYNVRLDHYTALNPKPFSCHKGMMIEILITMGPRQLKFPWLPPTCGDWIQSPSYNGYVFWSPQMDMLANLVIIWEKTSLGGPIGTTSRNG